MIREKYILRYVSLREISLAEPARCFVCQTCYFVSTGSFGCVDSGILQNLRFELGFFVNVLGGQSKYGYLTV